jgi:cell division septal protein FtsQ
MNFKSQILSIGLMILISVILLSLALGLDKDESIEFSKIEISGNVYQSSEQYYQFANLDQCIEQNLPVQIIRDRLEKHPYVQRAEIIFEGNGVISTKIIEKKFKAILLSKKKQYYLTNEFEALPIIGQIQRTDYPVISNIKLSGSELINSVNNIGDLKTAVQIIDAMKYLNPQMYAQISEVDLCNGNNLVLYFNTLKYPVVFGEKDGLNKVVYLNKLWNQLNKKKMGSMINYIDLRFEDKVYLGITEEYLADRNKRS